MRVPVSWLREYVELPQSVTGRELGEAVLRLGLEVETVDTVGGDVTGPLVIGYVKEVEKLTEFKKPISFCQVDVGPDNGGVRGIVCGAPNVVADSLVVVALPGAVLPGGFEIAARETYGKVSDGMICSARELSLGDDHTGIMILPPGTGAIGDPAGPLLGLGEQVLDIAVTPDRGYCLSIRGVAREAAIAYDAAFTDPGTAIAPLPEPEAGAAPHRCSSDDLTGCDVFTLRTITGINAKAPTPLWMQQRLIAAGMRPISIIVDVTNYVMLETGQPLHAFDIDRLSGALVARRAVKGEKLETLDHVQRTLDPEDLVIADDSGPLALAGTMGGLTTEISDDSTAVALEAAHFDPVAVARMSRRHKLSSEASRRFERGVDRALAPYASDRAASLLIELAGGHNVGMIAQEAASEASAIAFDPQLPARTAGMEISNDTVAQSLTAVGCELVETGEGLEVSPPTWRPDLTDPADLVEEVIRLIGYDQVPSKLPEAPAGRGLTPEQQLRRRAGLIAAGAGLTEVLNYPFIGDADLTKTGISESSVRRQFVRLANPISEEQPGMRTTLLPGLFSSARRNLSRGSDSVAIFEIGSIYLPPPRAGVAPRLSIESRPTDEQLGEIAEVLPVQVRQFGAVLTGPWQRSGWWGKGRSADWADAIELAKRVITGLGLAVEIESDQVSPWHPGRCAAIVVGGQVIGNAGELHPRVTAAWDLPERTVAIELDLDAAIEAARDEVVRAPEFFTMPVAKEDVALIVDVQVTAADVEAALADGAGSLLESVRLFDVYTGEQVGEGKKSLAFNLRFRAPDRTLGVDEVTSARDAAVARAAEITGASQRS